MERSNKSYIFLTFYRLTYVYVLYLQNNRRNINVLLAVIVE